ncbi:MAG: ribonucleoside-triphosphate reductase, adenosylcobalamin-dependent [Cyanobacteria bacterium REEB459]|nr:ribonucleoside-triphosphate reductase, adenosylcobalamin-dependent [Cyanobacteria bacterium REEB459]
MVQELSRIQQQGPFPATAPAAFPVFYRTYSRRGEVVPGQRESWQQVCDRSLAGLVELGHLTPAETDLLRRMQQQVKALPSGRWLWVGGTAWSKQPENFSGAYNCTSTNVVDWRAFGLMMDLAMMGCGTGAILEPKYISQIPAIRNRLVVTLQGEIGTTPAAQRRQVTEVMIDGNRVEIRVGDSRQGWVQSYQTLLELSTDDRFTAEVEVVVDLRDVRPAGERLKGFGGVANPVRLSFLYDRCATILNKALGRQLNSVECCLLIDEAAACVVAGNIRRSAGMRQFDSQDELAASAKDNLWQQDAEGNWRIDPERDVLRMANHTRVFHEKPSLQDCIDAVRKQFYSGEGAMQWAGEAKRRAGGSDRYGLNPCGEIIGSNFHCNLAEVHLNQIDPKDPQDQEDAFTAAALAVAVLLNHQFIEPRYQKSRLEDPIVGVSFTGLFDFFVNAFGVEWLRWWEAGRPDTLAGLEFKAREQAYLSGWRDTVQRVVADYCDRQSIKAPNRCTTVQPAGTKSLLTGASPGWHPPKSQRFIRRITFRKNDPVALACIDYGYSVVPSQSDKDEQGNLLKDPFDPRCTEWLVEIPVEVSWANLPGADQVAIEQFSAAAQFDFYMQVQRHYTTHNTSATIEFREAEIDFLAERIYQAIDTDEGYISAALLARFDDLQTFPRLPFEPIDKATYEALRQAVGARRRIPDFHTALASYDAGELLEAGPAGCDSDKCMLPEQKPD